MKRLLLSILVLHGVTGFARAETVTLATYNVEHFATHFDSGDFRKWATTQPNAVELRPFVQEEKRQDDEDNWEVAQVIYDDRFSPDVIVFQECCEEGDLKHFNKRWLRGMYQTVIVFPGNSGRGQHLGLMAKPEFEILERRDQYYLEKDPGDNPRGERLFARGPAFVLVESPGGYRFWVGVTHQKSKSGNSPESTAWRNREAKRTRQIILELAKEGPADVVLLGDINDELGVQPEDFEDKAGGDTVANLVGPPEDGLYLATRGLAENDRWSFGGYWVPTHRSFIDHIITTPDVKQRVTEVKVFNTPLARVASDHYPVYIRIRAPGGGAGGAPATRPTTPRAGEPE
ncbi:MAG: endonuclease/exonuclease/phosphatase family protein, partial [Tepidisphaeraceae bacterium]